MGEIADVEKYVARRISKSNLPGESDEKTKYDISPKMKKILGKFYHNEKNQLNLFSDCVNKESTSDINPLDLKTESSDGKKLISSNSKKISNSNFKKTVKLTKLEPKLIRRKSVFFNIYF